MAKPMRLAFIGAGNSKHIQRLARHMARRGHTVFVISADKFGPFPSDPGVTYLTFPTKGSPLAKIAAVRAHLREAKPEVLHSHFLNYGGFISVASGFHPHLASLWGCDILNVPHESTAKMLATKTALRASDWLLPVSRQLLDEALRISSGHPRHDIVNWGIDTEHFSPKADAAAFRARIGADPQEKIIFSPRILEWHYNQNVLIDALPLLKNGAKLVILRFQAVEGFEKKLREQVRAAGCEDRVIWVDELSYEQLPQAYCAADAVISIPRTDGTPMTVLEAMACGARLVASDVPSLRDWIEPGKTGELVNPLSAAAVAAGIDRILGLSPEAKAKMSAASRQVIADRVSMEKSLGHLEGIYAQAGQASGFDYLKSLRNLAGLRTHSKD